MQISSRKILALNKWFIIEKIKGMPQLKLCSALFFYASTEYGQWPSSFWVTLPVKFHSDIVTSGWSRKGAAIPECACCHEAFPIMLSPSTPRLVCFQHVHKGRCWVTTGTPADNLFQCKTSCAPWEKKWSRLSEPRMATKFCLYSTKQETEVMANNATGSSDAAG